MVSPQLLKKVEKLEAFAQMALDEATAIRKELQGGACNSSRKGKTKDAVHKVLANRRKHVNIKKQS